MRGRQVVSVTAIGGAAIVGVLAVRRWQLRWAATRAIAISAPADVVWPWIAQLGQGRGGFYSYDFLENLVGCDIHSAERVVAEWQSIDVGDAVHLHPEVGLIVAVLDPGRALVLRGAVSIGRMPPPYDFTWAFVLR